MGSSASKNKDKGSGAKAKVNTPPVPHPVEVEGGHYKPFTEFPSPVLLAQAHDDYKAAKVNVEKDNGGTPLPHPPPTSKQDVLAACNFSEVDRHARDAQSFHHAEGEYLDLVRYLVQPARNDVDKVRAFFMWIGSQTPQKVFHFLGDRSPPEGSPLRAMATIMAKKLAGLYNEVLQNLCKAGSIPCVLQRCSVKGSNYRVGQPVTTHGNTLCLVYVDRAWRMIDQHWGSESVSAVADDEWQLVQDKGATTNLNNYVQKVFHNVNEFYFLTDPSVMVYSHMCLEPKYQLLPRPVTSSEFDEIAYLKTGFFALGMTKLSHPKCKVICDSGTVQFESGHGKKKGLFYYNLYKSALDRKNDRFKGATPKEFSWMSETEDTLRLKIDFPWIGRYKLDIECEDMENRHRRYPMCEYLIEVSQPMFGAVPRPALPAGQDQLGVTAPIREMGIRAVDNEDGIIHANQGQANVNFSCQETRQFRIETLIKEATVHKGRVGTADMEKSILRYYKTMKGEISVYAKLSQSGNYLLTMNVVKDNQKSQKMNYLIESDQECTDLISNYPDALEPSGLIGDLSEDEENRLIPISHPCPQLDGPANGNTCFEMKQTSRSDLKIEAELFLNNDVCLNEFVYHEGDGEHLFFFTRFPRVGIYSLNIVSHQTEKQVSLYQYVINVEKPDTQCLPFPVVQNKCPDGFKIIQPKDGKLSGNAPIDFKYIFPEAKKVYLKYRTPDANEQHTYELSQDKNGTWSGTFSIDHGVRELMLVAEFENEEERDLLSYQIMDRDAENETKYQKKKAEKECAERQIEVKSCQEKSEKETKQKREAKEKEVQEMEADFKKNKSQYEEREKELEKQELKKEIPVEEEPDYTEIKLEDEMNDRNLDQKLKDAKKEADEGWRAVYNKKASKLLLERLKTAVAHRDLPRMETGVLECIRAGIKEDDSVIVKANVMIRVERAKAGLQTAVDEKDEQEILAEIQNIEDDKLLHYLQQEVSQARALLDQLARRKPSRVLDLDRKTMSEIRRYNNPSSNVHSVLQAALLLLGEDEQTTGEWLQVQKQCNPQGKNGLSRRILNFESDDLQPELAARARDILQDIDLPELKKQSAGVAVFYIWAMGVLDHARLDSDIAPAGIQRQREILGRLPPPPPEKSYQKYYRHHKNKVKSPDTPHNDGDQQKDLPIPKDDQSTA